MSLISNQCVGSHHLFVRVLSWLVCGSLIFQLMLLFSYKIKFINLIIISKQLCALFPTSYWI